MLMAALPRILSWSAIEQFQKLSQGSKTILSKLILIVGRKPPGVLPGLGGQDSGQSESSDPAGERWDQGWFH